ncbi:MAG: hypothetical protein QOI25_3406 [Mycobacterium sp.]|nr:hypothetical protein [Mycobacterium sp.]
MIDCRDPRRLADFYAGLLGGVPVAEDDTWVVLTDLDVAVDDVEDTERKVLALGGTRVTDAVGEDHFRVHRDPAGHTFCLVWGVG